MGEGYFFGYLAIIFVYLTRIDGDSPLWPMYDDSSRAYLLMTEMINLEFIKLNFSPRLDFPFGQSSMGSL